MKETRIKNFQQLHNALSKYKKDNQWLFRGHADISWKLVPKSGRKPYSNESDRNFFMAWKRRVKEFIDTEKFDDWNLLAIAQHHGLATRLLDWTYNPLIAAFFAVEQYYETDTVIYAYLNKTSVVTQDVCPFEINGIGKFKPNGASQRIIRQSGIFTIHTPPTLSLADNLKGEWTMDGALLNQYFKKGDWILEKIIIDKEYRKELLFDLSFYGIHKESLFPDLDGLCDYMNWYMENMSYWNGQSLEEVAAEVSNED